MAALSRQLFGLELDDDDEAEDLLADNLRMYTASTSLSVSYSSNRIIAMSSQANANASDFRFHLNVELYIIVT